jgi:16S rRNA processing protein RimM
LSTDRDGARFVALAEVARPHGVRGEVRLTVFNDDSDVLLGVDEVIVHMPDGAEHEVSVDAVRKADKALLMKLHSVDDRDRADELRGAQIGLKRGDLPPLGEGEFYFCDVEGAEVRLGEERVGVVERVVEYPTVTALVVRQDDGKELEVPLAEPYVTRVDAGSHVVHVGSLEGLP